MKEPSKIYFKNKTPSPGGGSITEIYSEVLAQVCLAFAIVKNRPMHWSDVVIGGDDPSLTSKGKVTLKKGWFTPSMQKLVVPPRGKSLNSGNSSFAEDLMDFSLDKCVTGFTWIGAQGRNMFELKKIFKLTRKNISYNDKIFGVGNDSPYKAFKKAVKGVMPDKWNPADMWIMTKEGVSNLKKMNSNDHDLSFVNQWFVEEYQKGTIIPISLKKPQSKFNIDYVNTNEYFARIALGKTNNPTIEFTDGNKDVKINFSIETVELPKGMTSARAARSPMAIRGKVKDTKDVRLKYTSDGNQLEIEYNQTKGNKYAEAKMGKIGTENIKDVINKTTKLGVSKLNQIQKKYKKSTFIDRNGKEQSFGIKEKPFYNLDQLGGGKPRKNDNVDNDNQQLHNLFVDYISEIAQEIKANDFPVSANLRERFGKGGKLSNSKDFWSKSRAGELGVAIGGVNQKVVQKRLIQNLYDVAASIAYATGLTPTEQILARRVGDVTSFTKDTSRNVQFRSGPYIKVY